MRHNYWLTKNYALIPTQMHYYGHVARYAYAYRYLFTFAAAETAPETVRVVRETKLKHVSV